MTNYNNEFELFEYQATKIQLKLIDVDVKHGSKRRSNNEIAVNDLVYNITKLVKKAEQLQAIFTSEGKDISDYITFKTADNYILYIISKCLNVFTTRQRKKVIEALNEVYATLRAQITTAEEYLASLATQAVEAPAVEEVESAEVVTTVEEVISPAHIIISNVMIVSDKNKGNSNSKSKGTVVITNAPAFIMNEVNYFTTQPAYTTACLASENNYKLIRMNGASPYMQPLNNISQRLAS